MVDVEDGLGSWAKRTVYATQWRFGSSLLNGLLQFATGIALARLLTPQDFGLVAVAMMLVVLATTASNLGLGPALIQRRDLSLRHIRVAFTASALLGLGAAALLVAVAPTAAAFFHAPRLTNVLRFLAPSFFLAGLGSTADSLLRRRLDFQTLFVVESVSYFLGYGTVAVGLALAGLGVWSLVAGILAQRTIGSILAYAHIRHSLRPLISLGELRQLAAYGVIVNLNALVSHGANSADTLVIGRWLDSHALGLYARAFALVNFPLSRTSAVLSSVLFPAFSEISSDLSRLSSAYLVSVRTLVLVVAPVMVGLAVAAPHLVLGVYGSAWEGSIAPLQVLCLVGIFRSVTGLAGSLTHAADRVPSELIRQLTYGVLVVGFGVLGAKIGLVGVATGVAAASGIMYALMAHLSLQLLDRSWWSFAQAHFPGLAVAVLVAVMASMARLLMEWLGLSSVVTAGLLVVVCGCTWLVGLHLFRASLPQDLRTRIERYARLVRRYLSP